MEATRDPEFNVETSREGDEVAYDVRAPGRFVEAMRFVLGRYGDDLRSLGGDGVFLELWMDSGRLISGVVEDGKRLDALTLVVTDEELLADFDRLTHDDPAEDAAFEEAVVERVRPLFTEAFGGIWLYDHDTDQYNFLP